MIWTSAYRNKWRRRKFIPKKNSSKRRFVIDGLQRKVACVGRSVNESAENSTHSPIVGFGNWTLSRRRGCTIRLDLLPILLAGYSVTPYIHFSFLYLQVIWEDFSLSVIIRHANSFLFIYSISTRATFLNKEICLHRPSLCANLSLWSKPSCRLLK